MVACILTLLLVVSLLPMTALADTIPDYRPGEYHEDILPGVTMNQNMGEVGTNGGTIKQNVHVNGFSTSGIVHVNDGTIEENYGQVVENFKTVENNEVGGSVGTNQDTGTIGTNNSTVNGNYGDIGTNNGMVHHNNGTIGTNNGTVSINNGTVETNGIDGVVYHNNGGAAGQSNDDAIETPTEQPPVVAGVDTNFGTVHNDADGNTYYGLSWGESVDKLNSIESFVEDGTEGINLNDYAAKASRSGYKMTGFTAFARKNGTDTKITDTANHTMKAPVWLQILWEKLGGKSESKATVANVPTHVAAGDVQEGTLVRCGNMVFLVIEVGEDYILVTTMSAQSKKDMEDPMAYLAKYLTPEQIELLQGSPEQLSEELAAKLFGGNTKHIVFKAAKNLFAA